MLFMDSGLFVCLFVSWIRDLRAIHSPVPFILQNFHDGLVELLFRHRHHIHLLDKTSRLDPDENFELVASQRHGDHGHAVVDGLRDAIQAPLSDQRSGLRVTYARVSKFNKVVGV